jgi:pSer/pThr/pTyr-binding forkhead associated (FHA) protein
MSGTPAKKAAPPRELTYLESDDEIRQALQARRDRAVKAQQAAKAQKPGQPVPLAAPVEPEPKVDRPTLRPPLALLCILDDGKAEGEWFRLRGDRCVIGRADGDVQIPHDGMMSSRHAEIVRTRAADGCRWMLTDLKSTNGSFVRIGKTILRHNHELVLGGGRYRFESGAAAVVAAAEQQPTNPQGTTQSWAGPAMSTLVPSFVEITPAGPGHRFPLTLPEYWLGRDPKVCRIVRPEDELLNARHARLYRDAGGQWHIENNKTLNGMWLRIDEIPLTGACHFRLGEQRFLFRVS